MRLIASFTLLLSTCLMADQPKVLCDAPTKNVESCCQRCSKSLKLCEKQKTFAKEEHCFELYTECSQKCKDAEKKAEGKE